MVINMFDIDKALSNFGMRLQEARIARNVTQDDLAEKCGVTSKHISAIERGISPGSITLLLNVCNYLGISPNTLFDDSFPSDNDSIIPIEKHDIFLMYNKLSKSNQEFIDSSITHIFEEQTRKS